MFRVDEVGGGRRVDGCRAGGRRCDERSPMPPIERPHRMQPTGTCAGLVVTGLLIIGVGCSNSVPDHDAAAESGGSPSASSVGPFGDLEPLPPVEVDTPATTPDTRTLAGEALIAYETATVRAVHCDELRRGADTYFSTRRPAAADEIDSVRLLASMFAIARQCGDPQSVPDDIADWTILDWVKAADEDVAAYLSAAGDDPLLRACGARGADWARPVPGALPDDVVMAYAVGKVIATKERCESFAGPDPTPGAFDDIADPTVERWAELGSTVGSLTALDEVECARFRHDPDTYAGDVRFFGPSERHATAYVDATLTALDELCPVRFG